MSRHSSRARETASTSRARETASNSRARETASSSRERGTASSSRERGTASSSRVREVEDDMVADEEIVADENLSVATPLETSSESESEPDIWENSRRVDEIKEEIRRRDKVCRSKKDPIRSELYASMKKYFRIYSADRFRIFLGKISDDKFQKFLKPKAGLENLKAWDMKYKILRILKIYEESLESRNLLYSTACMLNIVHLSKNPNKFKWKTYRLESSIQSTSATPTTNEFFITVTNKMTEQAENLEQELYHEDEPSNALFYVHSKISNGIIYLSIRRQISPSLNPRENRQKKKSRGRRVVSVAREVSHTMTIAILQNLPHIFVNGCILESDNIITSLTKCLGYESAVDQNLEGFDILRLINICKTTIAHPPQVEFEKKFREEEAKMAEMNLSWGNRAEELERQLNISRYRSAIDEGSQVNKGVSTFSMVSKFSKTDLKITGTPSQVEEHIIDLYKQGFITDLTPFLQMKETQSNLYNWKETETESES